MTDELPLDDPVVAEVLDGANLAGRGPPNLSRGFEDLIKLWELEGGDKFGPFPDDN